MAKPSFKRTDRVSDQIKQEIADILMRKIKDPRIGFVTVTDVDVADDLRNATVYVSVYGSDAEKEASLRGLRSAAAFIRSELGKRIRTRHVPDLLFRFDAAVERGAHIMELLREIGEEKDKKSSEDE